MSPEMAVAPQPRSFQRAVRLFRFRGVPVRLDWSWFIIAGLVLWLLHTRMAARLDEPVVVVVGAAAVATLLFFASVLVHELGHAHTSLDRGIPVAGVTLFMLGGVTESVREAVRARDEFVIVGAGPLLSLALAGAFWFLHSLAPQAQTYAIVVGYLAWGNLALGLFNLVPGFPLDGGRLLRSVLWGVTGRPHRATRWAARTGQAFALALGGLGLWVLFAPVGGLGGVWELLIAAFLFKGASDAHRQARLRERMAGRTAGALMGGVPEVLDPHQPLHRAVLALQQRPSLLWPVGDPVQGSVRLAEVEAVPREQWAYTTLGDVALPATATTVGHEATMDTVLPRMADGPGQMLLVTDDAGHPVGLLTPSLVTEQPQG